LTAGKRSPDITDGDAVEVSLAQGAHRLRVWAHNELGTERREHLVQPVILGSELDDGGQRHRFLGAQAVSHHGEQSIH
jgi:hypothetical protein